MAGTNGEPYPADSNENLNPPGQGEMFDSFDEHQQYDERTRDRGWSVVEVTPAYNPGGDPRANELGNNGINTPPPIPAAQRRPVRGANQSGGNTGLILGIGVVALVAVLGALLLSWMAFNRAGDNSNDVATNVVGEQNATTNQVQQTMQSLGLAGVLVEQKDQTVYLSGTVSTEDELRIATSAASSLVGDLGLDTTGLAVAGTTINTDDVATPTAPATPSTDSVAVPQDNPLQDELNRTIASRPIIFDTAQTSLTAKHLDILQSVAQSILKFPDASVMVVGWSDSDGSTESNQKISLLRANAVQDALIGMGVNASQLSVDARGETGSSNSKALGALDRRVEFEVAPATGGSVVAAAPGDTLRIGIVAPSSRDDVAFSQSMVDAINVIAEERGEVEIDITDNTFEADKALAAIQNYANQDYDLVIAHGTQFGRELQDLVVANPQVAFAWGTSSDNFGLPNLYAYSVNAQEGGYVLGAMAGKLSETGTVGVVGPIAIGDAAAYVNGFTKGAQNEAGAQVLVEYTDSFSATDVATDAANRHIDANADVLSGTAQMFTGAVAAAEANGSVRWFGNQSNQSAVSPDIVVASQVYRWEVIMRDIVADIDRGQISGRTETLTLDNGGLDIAYNPEFVGLPDEVKALGDDVERRIRSGELTVTPD